MNARQYFGAIRVRVTFPRKDLWFKGSLGQTSVLKLLL